MVSSVTTGTSFTATPPRPLFALTGLHDYLEGFIVSADGQRFIYLAPNPDAAATEIHVVLNWAEEVRATMAER